MVDKECFDLHLKPEVARTMNREQYYAARSWLRYVRWVISKAGILETNMRMFKEIGELGISASNIYIDNKNELRTYFIPARGLFNSQNSAGLPKPSE